MEIKQEIKALEDTRKSIITDKLFKKLSLEDEKSPKENKGNLLGKRKNTTEDENENGNNSGTSKKRQIDSNENQSDNKNNKSSNDTDDTLDMPSILDDFE